MKKLLLIFLNLPTFSFAETVASCQNPKGHTYYPFNDMTIKKDAGWFKDEIYGGSYGAK